MALTDLDRTLIEDCLARKPGAWKAFVDRYSGLFVHVIQHTGYTRSVSLTPEDIDDLCADVLLAVLQDDFAVLRHFRGEASLATYLSVIARRVVVRALIQKRVSEALGHVRAHQESVETALDEQGDVGRIENREVVDQMLEGLPEREATVVRLYHLEGRTYREISTSLKMPENSVGPLLSRAMDKLRRTGLVAH